MTESTPTMRATVLGEYGKTLDIRQVPRPVAGPDQLLVRQLSCGSLGLYAVQLASRLGAQVIAVDRDPAKLENTRRHGATKAELANSHLPTRVAARAERLHACINFAPTVATWDTMYAGIRPRRRIVAVAMVFEPVPLVQERLTATGVTITGTRVGTRRKWINWWRWMLPAIAVRDRGDRIGGHIVCAVRARERARHGAVRDQVLRKP